MRSGKIFKHDKSLGTLHETTSGSIVFSYDEAWRANEREWVSLTLPFTLCDSPLEARNLPSFFDGLIPEGWLLDIACKLKPELNKDRFGLLLAIAKDCIGSVSVIPDGLNKPEEGTQSALACAQIPAQAAVERENPYGRCLVCMDQIDDKKRFYHDKCARNLFGVVAQLKLPYLQEEFEALAEQNVKARLIVPGAQRKISASLTADHAHRHRITLVGTGEYGLYILKPQHPLVPEFPVNEHLAMSLARVAGIPTAEFGLIMGEDQKLTYITRRFDRQFQQGSFIKRSMEDFGQLFGRTRDNDKYKESFDRIGKYLNERSGNRLIDVVRLFDQVFLSYLIGNNDFHLRNIAVFTDANIPVLTPAYDITITQLIDPEPLEDVTLPVNGKKNNIRRGDWLEFCDRIGINKKAAESRITRFEKMVPHFLAAIAKSLLPESQKSALVEFMQARLKRALNGR